MPPVPIHNIGLVGVVRDITPYELPPEVWSDGANVRFNDNKVETILGHKPVFDPPSVAPLWAMNVHTATTNFWLYSSVGKVYTFDGANHFDITRAVGGDYATTVTRLWTGGSLGGIPIITNGVDVPQMWTPIGSGQPLQDLTNWPAGHLCQVIRPFKAYLIALFITKSGVAHPHMIRWSHPADPGSVPSSWDETDPTKDAGEFELEDAHAGTIKDGLALGDMFVVYKDNAIWGLQHIGGRFIFRRFGLFENVGAMSNNCVASVVGRGGVQGRRHLVATGDDLVVHNGQSLESIIDKRWKRFIQTNLDSENFDRSFIVGNRLKNEMWFCFPEVGSTWPSIALVWNTIDGGIGVRKLSDIAFIAPGVIQETSDETWDADTGTWDSDESLWGQQAFRAYARELLMCDPVNTKLYQAEKTNQFNGANFTAYIERQDLGVVGKDRQGNPKVDLDARKLVTRIWPKASGGTFNIRVGVREEIGGMITWSPLMPFSPGTDKFVTLNPPLSGRLISVRFESMADVNWTLDSYDLDITPLGVF